LAHLRALFRVRLAMYISTIARPAILTGHTAALKRSPPSFHSQPQPNPHLSMKLRQAPPVPDVLWNTLVIPTSPRGDDISTGYSFRGAEGDFDISENNGELHIGM
jgi:hypothetical protein